MNRFAAIAMAVMCLVAVGEAQVLDKTEKKPAKWTVHYVAVGKKAPAVELESGIDGTTVKARIEFPDQLIVGVNLNASKLTSFYDDKKTDLLATRLRFGVTDHIRTESNFHGEKSANITFRAGGRPAAGATRIEIKGELGVFIAKDEKKLELKDIVLGRAVELPFGRIQNKSIADTWDYLGTKPLLKVILVDSTGKSSEPHLNTGFTAPRTGEAGEFRASLSLQQFSKAILKAPQRATLHLAYFDHVEFKLVPIDLYAGLGN